MVVDSGHGLTSGSAEGGEIARQGALVGGMLTGELCVDDDWCMTGERPKALILLLLVLLVLLQLERGGVGDMSIPSAQACTKALRECPLNNGEVGAEVDKCDLVDGDCILYALKQRLISATGHADTSPQRRW